MLLTLWFWLKAIVSRNVCQLIGGWFSSFLQTQIRFEITNCFYLFSGITIGNEAHWFFTTVRNMQWDLLDCNSLIQWWTFEF